MAERARRLGFWYDAYVPSIVLALSAFAFALADWQIATGTAIGALAGYSLSGSV
jgi:hypothetical protein